MKIELKNIKHSPSLSEETNAFTASLYVDGKKVGYCKNSGHGGETEIRSEYSKDEAKWDNNRKILAEAETYCDNLPPITDESGKNPLDMSLDFYVDLELEKILKAKDVQKGLNKLNRECVKKIVIVSKKVLEGYKENKNDLTWSQVDYKTPLVEVHQRIPKVFKTQIAKIQSNLKGDEFIYNENLPD